jgi:hypothetical protein
MKSILWKVAVGHILNDEDDVWSNAAVLLWVHRDALDFFLNIVNHTESSAPSLMFANRFFA